MNNNAKEERKMKKMYNKILVILCFLPSISIGQYVNTLHSTEMYSVDNAFNDNQVNVLVGNGATINSDGKNTLYYKGTGTNTIIKHILEPFFEIRDMKMYNDTLYICGKYGDGLGFIGEISIDDLGHNTSPYLHWFDIQESDCVDKLLVYNNNGVCVVGIGHKKVCDSFENSFIFQTYNGITKYRIIDFYNRPYDVFEDIQDLTLDSNRIVSIGKYKRLDNSQNTGEYNLLDNGINIRVYDKADISNTNIYKLYKRSFSFVLNDSSLHIINTGVNKNFITYVAHEEGYYNSHNLGIDYITLGSNSLFINRAWSNDVSSVEYVYVRDLFHDNSSNVHILMDIKQDVASISTGNYFFKVPALPFMNAYSSNIMRILNTSARYNNIVVDNNINKHYLAGICNYGGVDRFSILNWGNSINSNCVGRSNIIFEISDVEEVTPTIDLINSTNKPISRNRVAISTENKIVTINCYN